MLHGADDCFGKHTNHKTIKDGLGGPMGSRDEAVKQYNNSESNWKKELKDLKNQNNMLFSITKKSRSRFELKNINNVREKASKKRCDSISNYSSDELDSDSSLSRYIY